MARWTPRLAKLTRPRLHDMLMRDRLFAALDGGRDQHSAVWVAGPPGAGKTMLVASWLDAREHDGIWYQVDPGDADIPTFFYYLVQAARPYQRKGQAPLPLLTPEFLPDVEGFSRRFFRELFARMPRGSTLVLDNYHELPIDHLLHQMLANVLDEVPEHVMLISISRLEPPQPFARATANRLIGTIDWNELKFTLPEARIVVSSVIDLDEQQLQDLHQRSAGWAAGFVLLLESARRGRAIASLTAPDSLRDIFDYFAGQLFDRATLKTQNALLQLSYLPRITARYAEAFGSDPRLLEDLFRRHLFTDRRMGDEPVYQFHALFRSFLQQQARDTLPLPMQIEVATRAAALLERDGQGEDALALYLLAGDQASAIRIIEHESARLIGQGRWQVVVAWVEKLPVSAVDNNPWLLHWQGSALIGVDPPSARAALEHSFHAAVANGDKSCQLQSVAAIIETHVLEYTHFLPLDRWIETLEGLLSTRPVFHSADAELRTLSALLIAYTFRRPDSLGVPGCAERVFRLIDSDAGVGVRTTSAAYLAAYGASTGPLEIARRVTPQLDRMIGHPDITVRTTGWCLFISAFAHMVLGEQDESRASIDRLLALSEEHRLPSMQRLAAVIGTNVEIGAGRLDVARDWLGKLKQVLVRGNPYDEASFETLTAWLAAHSGDTELAGDAIGQAVTFYDEGGQHYTRCFSRVQRAMICLLLGHRDESRRWVDEAMSLAQVTRAGWLEVEAGLVAAHLALDEHDDIERARLPLQRALALARQEGFLWPFRFLRRWVPRLLEAALELGIEHAYVREPVRRLGLQPPSAYSVRWPWPVKIYTLGGFRVLIDDEEIKFGRKAPRRLLLLLMALVTFGGRGVPIAKFVDTLWADIDGDSANDACERAFHRLRALLVHRESLTIENGRISLQPELVWTDVSTVEHLLASRPDDEEISDAIFTHYRGDFLAGEMDAAWALPLRHHLRQKLAHRLTQCGMRLEHADRTDDAITLNLRALEIDPDTETYYCGLMRCYHRIGDRANALAAYQRLCDRLMAELGRTPAASTEELARRLEFV